MQLLKLLKFLMISLTWEMFIIKYWDHMLYKRVYLYVCVYVKDYKIKHENINYGYFWFSKIMAS